jgi:co-chaperonin GroES (HSP10)
MIGIGLPASMRRKDSQAGSHPRHSQGKTPEGRVSRTPRQRHKDNLIPQTSSRDRRLFAKWAGTEFKLDGEERMIKRKDDILGVIEA